ncbi:TonB-dependent receptor [Dysgonomonas sp. 511]|uniref:SusC/RagA family TonB-linked outer membrane protein n=1 Tax=Dysgonomonas sp. 511 TaxID=2302930 RepID=UPI002104C79E|nr:TonB-dependent receptor [Dysgonomonas sp. 511]
MYKILLVMAMLCPLFAFAQNNRNITGTVTDAATGETLIGVSVVQKGTTNGTMTDVDGKYSINVPENSTLVFTYLGFNTVEIKASSSTIDVKMQEQTRALDEVIVIGYGTQRKADITTAVASVSAEEWENRPIMSAQQALQGKASGVQVVQPSGKPGVGIQVRVRGATSLNAGNDPIYVVDGIITNDISNISPSDIENMQILKDASSAAIYGSRAANGVVLITTKRGAKGKAQVDISMYAGFSNITKNIKTLNTKEYYNLMEEIGLSVDRTNHNYTNWAKEMYGTGYQQNYQASVSGSTDKTSYYVSGNYQQEKGVISPAEYDRFSFRSNISSEVTSWLKINTNMSFARNTRMDATDNANSGRGGIIMSIINTPPSMPIWDVDNPGQYATNPYQSSWENPYAQANTYDKNREYRFMGNLELDFTILEGLHFKPRFSADFTSHTWDKFIDPIKTGYGRQANGRGEHADDDYLTWQSENILSYNKKFNESHNFGFVGGATFQRYRHNNAYMSVEDFVKGTTYETMTLNMANKINNATTSKDGNSLISYLARVQYDYESRYLFTANFRTDGSSKLYHKWAYFPSASAGWRFSSEKFFEPLTNVVDDAKLRIGWGRIGNQGGIGSYDSYDKYNISKQETSGEGPAVTPGKLGNRDLKWEKTTQYNAGFDFSFFNSRLIAEIDAYYKKTTDLLLETKLPSSTGISFPMRNDGEMVNKGFEFNLNGKILTGSFKWDANLNMSFNKNKLSKLGLTKRIYTANIESTNDDIIIVKEGLPLGSFYGYISEGVDPETGDIMYRDLDGNGQITPDDKTVIGDAQPDFTFGFTHNLSWKNFTLSAFFNGSYGNDIFNATRIDSEGMFDSKNQSTTVLNRWVRPGMITDVPRAGNLQNSWASTRFVEDGSFIRLKSLTLSYNFDPKICRLFAASKLNIYGTVNNLFTLTKYRGYDPELSWTSGNAAQLGIDMGTYPQARTFIFGFNLTF